MISIFEWVMQFQQCINQCVELLFQARVQQMKPQGIDSSNKKDKSGKAKTTADKKVSVGQHIYEHINQR